MHFKGCRPYTAGAMGAETDSRDVLPDLPRRRCLAAFCALPALALPMRLAAALPTSLHLVNPVDIEPMAAPAFSAVELTVQLAEAVIQRAGMQPIRVVLPWQRGQAYLRDGGADCVCTIATPEREHYLHFVQRPLLRDEACLWFHRRSPHVEQMRRMAGLADRGALRPIMYRGSGWTAALLGNQQPIVAPTAEAMIRMVAAGRADFFLDGHVVAMSRLHRVGMLADFECRPLPVSLPFAFRMGISRRHPDMDAVAAVLDAASANLEAEGYFSAEKARFIARFPVPA